MTGSAPKAPDRHPIPGLWWRHLIPDLQAFLIQFGSREAETRPFYLVPVAVAGRRGVAGRLADSDDCPGLGRPPCSAVSDIDLSCSRRPLVPRRGPCIGGPAMQGPCCG
jgi:hypothetical protein